MDVPSWLQQSGTKRRRVFVNLWPVDLLQKWISGEAETDLNDKDVLVELPVYFGSSLEKQFLQKHF